MREVAALRKGADEFVHGPRSPAMKKPPGGSGGPLIGREGRRRAANNLNPSFRKPSEAGLSGIHSHRSAINSGSRQKPCARNDSQWLRGSPVSAPPWYSASTSAHLQDASAASAAYCWRNGGRVVLLPRFLLEHGDVLLVVGDHLLGEMPCRNPRRSSSTSCRTSPSARHSARSAALRPSAWRPPWPWCWRRSGRSDQHLAEHFDVVALAVLLGELAHLDFRQVPLDGILHEGRGRLAGRVAAIETPPSSAAVSVIITGFSCLPRCVWLPPGHSYEARTVNAATLFRRNRRRLRSGRNPPPRAAR